MAKKDKSNLVLPQTHEDVVHHKRRKRTKGDESEMQLRLTAMIDVVFQLLIYFVVTASFALDEGILTTQLPTGSGTGSAADMKKRPLTVVLTSVNDSVGYRVKIEGSNFAPRNFAQLSDELRDSGDPRFREPHHATFPIHGWTVHRPSTPASLRRRTASKSVERSWWTHVVNAYNAAYRAGYSNINFARVGG